jgi:hypothetical protein
MHVHALRDDDLPAEDELVVQRAGRHGSASQPQPIEDGV